MWNEILFIKKNIKEQPEEKENFITEQLNKLNTALLESESKELSKSLLDLCFFIKRHLLESTQFEKFFDNR